MAKLKAHVEDFLRISEYLGYDEYNLPELNHFEWVLRFKIPFWEYHGYKSEKSYYTKRKPSKTSDEVIKKYWDKFGNNWEYSEKYYSSCCTAVHNSNFSFDYETESGLCSSCGEHADFDKHIEYGANDGE
tara:strand:+ start:289 stop:678 length:390 start_codon:yes stop_codon:yes gene_type:complete